MKSRSLVLAIVGTMILLGLASATVSAASSAGVASVPRVPERVLRIRASYGLSATVAAAAKATGAKFNADLIGVPVTRQEFNQLSSRFAARNSLINWEVQAKRNHVFGGVTQIQRTGELQVKYVREASAKQQAGLRRQVVALVKGRVEVKLVPTDISRAELDQEYAAVNSAYDQLVGLGASVSGIWEDLADNKIVLYVSAQIPDSALALLRSLAPTAAVQSATLGSGYSRDATQAPVWGGTYISNTASAGGGFCSSNVEGTNGTGTKFMLTAGHCWPEGTRIYIGNPPDRLARAVGTVHANNFLSEQPSTCDCELVNLAQAENIIAGSYTGGARDASQPTPYVYSRAGRYNEATGNSRRVCFSGYSSGLKCGLTEGPITAVYSDHNNKRVESIKTNIDVIGGDSGGPVGDGGTWFGPIGGGFFRTSGQTNCDSGCSNGFFSIFRDSSYEGTSWYPSF